MKRILQIFATIICIMFCTCAHTQVLTVKFTGRDQTGQHYVKLDHVKTFNLDQLWEEVLYFPDTTLVLGGVGIIDYSNSAISQLEQNIPNPFDGTTNFTLYLREGADILLEIFDLMGKSVVNQHYTDLSAGAHLFSANLTNPQVYILKVSVKNEQMHLKMVNKGYGAENSINHVSASFQNGKFESGAKDSQSMGIYPFQQGDELQHTGYTVINGVEYKSETITQQQNESETLILPFNFTLPTVTTSAINPINNSSIQCGGNVTSDGGLSVTAKGVCWNTLSNPTINDNHTIDGSSTGSFTSNITNLAPGVTHYFRAYATNGAGTVYGEQRSYSTQPILPTVTTSAVSNITATSATCGGNVTSTGGAAVYSRGICWSISPNPTIADNHITDGSGIGNFIISLTNLSPGTTYYVRAFATNSVGTAYGNQMCFTTQNSDGQPCFGAAIVTDIDNNTYNTVLIGNQCWMKENLRTTRYTNGDSIPLDNTGGYNPCRCEPNNDSSSVTIYGYLYNWAAVMHGASSSASNPSGIQGICPTGWHVPSDAEWIQLINYVSSRNEYVCGNDSTYITKSLADTIRWTDETCSDTCGISNHSTNNATGFTAVPAGYYYSYFHQYYDSFGRAAYFWTSQPCYRGLYICDEFIHSGSLSSTRDWYHSVRCVKD